MDRFYSSLTGLPIKGSLATEIRCAHREGCAKMKEESDHHLQTRQGVSGETKLRKQTLFEPPNL